MILHPNSILNLQETIRLVLLDYSGSFSDLAGDNIIEEISKDLTTNVLQFLTTEKDSSFYEGS